MRGGASCGNVIVLLGCKAREPIGIAAPEVWTLERAAESQKSIGPTTADLCNQTAGAPGGCERRRVVTAEEMTPRPDRVGNRMYALWLLLKFEMRGALLVASPVGAADSSAGRRGDGRGNGAVPGPAGRRCAAGRRRLCCAGPPEVQRPSRGDGLNSILPARCFCATSLTLCPSASCLRRSWIGKASLR